MALQVELFADNQVLGDLKRKIGQELKYADNKKAMTPWLEYLMNFEDHFKQNIPLPGLLKNMYPRNPSEVSVLSAGMSEWLAPLFQDRVCRVTAKTEKGQSYFVKKAYERALYIVDAMKIAFEKMDRSENSDEMLRIADVAYRNMRRYIEMQIEETEERAPEGMPEYQIDYEPVKACPVIM